MRAQIEAFPIFLLRFSGLLIFVSHLNSDSYAQKSQIYQRKKEMACCCLTRRGSNCNRSFSLRFYDGMLLISGRTDARRNRESRARLPECRRRWSCHGSLRSICRESLSVRHNAPLPFSRIQGRDIVSSKFAV